MIGLKTRTGAGTLLATGLCFGLAGCSLLPAADPVVVNRYTLDYPVVDRAMDPSGPVILVARIQTRAGLASQRMMYRSSAHSIGYFSRSQWAVPPGDMLASLIVDALESTGRFRAVVQPGIPVNPDFRLDIELVDLYQDFSTSPGSVRLRVRARLLDMHDVRSLASQQFEYSETFSDDDAGAGVISINALVARFLPALAEFCADSIP